MDKIIKNCSLKIEEKDKELDELKEKIIFLNKKIKTLEKTNFVNISNTIYNNNKSEAFSLINSNNKKNNDISDDNYKKYPIKIIKKNKNSSNDLSSFNNNFNKKKNTHSSTVISTINLNQSETNIFKKTIKLNNNKTNTLDENINISNKICLKKNARRNLNNNSRNNFRKNSYIKMAKVSTNITNNNYNVQKNNVLINLNSMNMEKKIIQQKLQKYLKIINTKINNLKNKTNRKIGLFSQSKSFYYRNLSSDRIDSFRNSEKKNKRLDKSSLINSTLFEKFNSTNRNFNKIHIYNMKKQKKK